MKRTSRRKRSSRRNPPPLYRAVGVDSSGHRVSLGAGPLARLRESTMAKWLGDPTLRSAYVLDARGHSYLSLEPKDRTALRANGRRRTSRNARSVRDSMRTKRLSKLSLHFGQVMHQVRGDDATRLTIAEESLLDGMIQDAAQTLDQLSGHRQATLKKVRKALGFTYP